VIERQWGVTGEEADRGSVQKWKMYVLLSVKQDARERNVPSVEHTGSSQARPDVCNFRGSWLCSVAETAAAL
jgi:hypothetical protein